MLFILMHANRCPGLSLGLGLGGGGAGGSVWGGGDEGNGSVHGYGRERGP